MLVLSRKVNQRIVLSNGITVTVIALKGEAVRLGIEAPKDVVILREELVPKCEDDRREGCSSRWKVYQPTGNIASVSR